MALILMIYGRDVVDVKARYRSSLGQYIQVHIVVYKQHMCKDVWQD